MLHSLKTWGWTLLLAGGLGANAWAAGAEGVQITSLEDRLRVEIHGRLFTEYHFKNVPRPFCYPLIGPGGAAMTRNWPMRDVPDEERDHPHHRSFWFTHGAVNGVDFWSESTNAGRIVHQKFTQVQGGRKEGIIRSENQWVARDGTVVCADQRTLRILGGAGPERLVDFEVTVLAPGHDVVFGDTKEGSFALRLAETMRLKGKVGKGHIVLSTGERDQETWGKRAAWCDYHGPVDNKLVGVALFDHPLNPRHPTWWHVRDYGLFAANPFGQHDFEKKPAGAGDYRIPAGQSATFRYRVYLHEGDAQAGRVAARYEDYIRAAGAAPTSKDPKR